MYDEFVYREGKSIKVACKPYIRLEGSIHKPMLGHNVHSGPTDFQEAVSWFITDISKRLGLILPNYSEWFVRRVDWAEVYELPSPAITQYFRGLRNCTFPRRKIRQYGLETVFCPGTTTTIKMYHKGPEFKKHDFKRLMKSEPKLAHNLLEMAHNRLRVEVGVNPRKLDELFSCKPLVSQITDAFLTDIHDEEIRKLIRETEKPVNIVRNNEAVQHRLNQHCKRQTTSRNLFGFWLQLSTLGEEVVRSSTPKATFYRHRKELVDAGISWHNTDIRLFDDNISILPADFKPLRSDSRYCAI